LDLLRGVAERPRIDEPPHRARFASGGLRGLVDARVARLEVARLQVAERGQPPVGLLAHEAQHPRLVGADPDGHVVRGARTALGAVDVMELAARDEAALAVDIPDAADDVDGLRERRDRIGGREAASAHGLDGIPEPARAETELDATLGEQVEARDRALEYRGLTQREVVHV